ncbi:ABC transporter ATP-binding protein [Streptomyces sp. NPDC044780]|uniref:energy-coupling factor ABC transporter ATP-binding protein n=1 Tax=unclassified Streptomyces TaxID=2593676 RepID=UPI0033F9DABD
MTDTVIRVNDLSLRYRGADRRALDEVSFDVARGEVLGILGPTGAGKSTLLKCLAGVIPHYEHDSAHRGTVEVLGHSVAGRGSLAEVVADVGLVLQDPEVQLVNTTVREELAWGMENRGTPVAEIHRRLARSAGLFGVERLLDRFTHALSGGEKQRTVVAATYCLGPQVMLLDEPTSELDPAGTESVLQAVRVLAREGVTVVVVEHKVEELAQYADRLMVLDEGRVTALGTPREVFTGEHAPYRPQVLEVALRLRDLGRWSPAQLPLTVDDAVAAWRPTAGAASAVTGKEE